MKKRLLVLFLLTALLSTVAIPPVSFAAGSEGNVFSQCVNLVLRKHSHGTKPPHWIKPPTTTTTTGTTTTTTGTTTTTPIVETPVVETPVVETPVVETPVVETPVVETPVVETPVVETPVVETPVVETPVVTTPVVVQYAVNIDSLTNGTVTADLANAEAGAAVNLTVIPDDGYQLKTGTLKYNGTEINGTSFIMPDSDVLITAEFELLPKSYLFKDDFENVLQSFWQKEMANTPHAGAISNNYAYTGSSSYRIELDASDPNVNGSKRSELTLYGNEQPLEEHTYNFAVMLPSGGDEDYAYDPGGSEIIAQWHNSPDPGEEWTMPPLALHTCKGRYLLQRIWDDAALSTDDEILAKGNFAEYDLGSYAGDKGRFVQWSFKIKWGWLDSQNPRIEIFKDGAKILDVKGPNTTNDQTGVYQKIGIYKWCWAQGTKNNSTLTKRVIYYDNFSVE